MSLIFQTFCTFAVLFAFAPHCRCSDEKSQRTPFPSSSGGKDVNLPPIDALKLTSGEWKRSVENRTKINPPMPETASKQAGNMKQDGRKDGPIAQNSSGKCVQIVQPEVQLSSKLTRPQKNVVFVTSTTTVDCLPFITTVTSPSPCPPQTQSCTPKCSYRHIAVVTENVVITEYAPERVTSVYDIYTTHTCTSSIIVSQMHHLTSIETKTTTVTDTIPVIMQQTSTHHTTLQCYPPIADETVTLTSTKVSIMRVPESTSQVSTPCPLATSTTTETCTCPQKDESRIKKIIMRLPRCKRDCKQVPWWMKNLTPKYDPEKGIAYKKQIYETERTGPSKCAAPRKKPSGTSGE